MSDKRTSRGIAQGELKPIASVVADAPCASHASEPSRRLLVWLFGLIAAVASGLAISPPAASAGLAQNRVLFERDVRTDFNRYITHDRDDYRDFIHRNFYRMRGYVPYFTQYAVDWAPPSRFYKNSYAIYNDRKDYPGRPDLKTLDSHPDWVLKGRGGQRLYIPFNCNGRSCPALAADFGNPGYRKWWIDAARDELREGYRGIYIDDVNLEWRTGNASGDFRRPIDPRTGRKMRIADYRRYFADFLTQIRKAFPNAELAHNSLWFAPPDNLQVRRQMAAADFIQIERGFNDAGIVGGDSKYGFVNLLRYISTLHKRGNAIILRPHDLNRSKAQYELAGYFLVRTGQDSIVSEFRATPDNFWRGWRTNLGRPRGHWYRWRGLFRRDYAAGMTLVTQPDMPSIRVNLPSGSRWTTVSGKTVKKLRLSPRSGRVLKKG